MNAIAMLFALVTASLAITYVAATLYYKYKENKWEAAMKELIASPPTEAEQAIGDEWQEAQSSLDNPGKIPMPNREELRDHMAARAVAELEEFEGKCPGGYEPSTEYTAANQLAELIESLRPRLAEDEHKKFTAAIHKAQQILEEEAADEEFFRKTCEEAKAGPVPVTVSPNHDVWSIFAAPGAGGGGGGEIVFLDDDGNPLAGENPPKRKKAKKVAKAKKPGRKGNAKSKAKKRR